MIEVRSYELVGLEAMAGVWNEVVRDGIAFPQEDELDETTGSEFLGSQTRCGVAVEGGRVLGLHDSPRFGIGEDHPDEGHHPRDACDDD